MDWTAQATWCLVKTLPLWSLLLTNLGMKTEFLKNFDVLISFIIYHLTIPGLVYLVNSFKYSSNVILVNLNRYLIERRGFEPEDAINGILLSNCHILNIFSTSCFPSSQSAFNQTRGHKIERENYLLSLRGLTRRVCRNPAPLFNGM
jgi:hypothetical protein